jgi:AcrR family transcriptional regulator
MTDQRRSKGHVDTGARERLVVATRECVRDRGLADTSSRAITERAGVNLAAITYYFGSKDDLIAAALADELRDWLQPALDELRQTDDPTARLLGAISILSTRFDAERDRVPGLLEVFVHGARDPAARAPIVEIWTEVRAHLRTTLEELRARDAVPLWVDPNAMATLIIAVVAGTVVNETVDPGHGAHRDVAAQFANLLVGASSGR